MQMQILKSDNKHNQTFHFRSPLDIGKNPSLETLIKHIKKNHFHKKLILNINVNVKHRSTH